MTTQRRPPQPEDLYRFRIPTRPRLSPDGEQVAFVVQTVAPAFDAYRQSVWLAPADGSEAARRLTVGPRRDHSPEFSPDGRTLAFLSDRRGLMEEEPAKGDESKRDDLVQVHLLPLVGGGKPYMPCCIHHLQPRHTRSRQRGVNLGRTQGDSVEVGQR